MTGLRAQGPDTLRGYLSRNRTWLAAGVLLTFLSSFGQTFFISVFAGEIRQTFDLSLGQWGGIYTLGTGLSAAAMLWTGALTDRFRVRALGPVVLAGLAAACLAMALNPWATGLVAVVFALRLFGQGMCSHIAVVAMARWFDATRGRALSIATLGFSFGEAILPVTFVALMPFVGWRALWMLAAIIAILAIWPLVRLLRAERTPQAHAERSESRGMRNRHWTRSEALAHPLFWILVPAMLGPPAFNTAFFFHQVHIAGIKGWTHLDLVTLFPAYTAMSVLTMVASGWALDKVGSLRLMPFTQVPMIVAFLIFSAATSTGGMLAGLLFLAMTTGTMATIPNAFWAEIYGTAHIGAIKAMAAAVMVLGSALGPGLTGWLIDAGFGLERQFVAMAVYFLGSSVLMAVGAARARRDMRPAPAAPGEPGQEAPRGRRR